MNRADLEEIVHDAREYALTEQTREFADLGGACHENAVGLAEYLHYHTQLTPHITWGYLKESKSDSVDSVEDAEPTGRVHFWCEVNPSGNQWYTLDIYALSKAWSSAGFTDGDVIVYEGLPPEYHRPDQSRFRYEGWIKPGHLLGEDDYNMVKSRLDFSN